MKVDPIRVVEAVTAGIAFLAAGTILFSRGEVHGLTTGAGMWLAGAIGLACGLGFWQIATFATVLVLIVLGAAVRLRGEVRPQQGQAGGSMQLAERSKVRRGEQLASAAWQGIACARAAPEASVKTFTELEVVRDATHVLRREVRC